MTGPAAPRRTARFMPEDAVRLALNLGIADFSMSRVAAGLGVTAPALYRCFADRRALVDACLAEIARETAPYDGPDDWRPALDHLADLQWTAYSRHPGLDVVLASYEGSVRQAMPGSDVVYRTLLRSGYSFLQITFALLYITGLTTTATAHLHRHLAEMERTAGSPDARVFRLPDGSLASTADKFITASRNQWRSTVDFFLDHLATLGHDWPEQTGPVAVPAGA